jgi:hypothetical protein
MMMLDQHPDRAVIAQGVKQRPRVLAHRAGPAQTKMVRPDRGRDRGDLGDDPRPGKMHRAGIIGVVIAVGH